MRFVLELLGRKLLIEVSIWIVFILRQIVWVWEYERNHSVCTWPLFMLVIQTNDPLTQMFSSYCLMILQIVISEHLRESPLEHVEPWSCVCLMKAGDSITDVQWLLSHDLADSNRWTSMRKSLLEHAQLCSCSCLIQVKPSQIVSDYYLQDHEKIITEHLWWSHLPFSKNYRVMVWML